MDKSYVKN